jgi:hypothetical protein
MRTMEPRSLSLTQQHGQLPSRWQRWFSEMLTGRGWVSLLVALAMCGLLIGGSSFVYLLPYTDVAKYQCYAFAFWHGGSHYPADVSCDFIQSYASVLPFHTLPREYPALALIPFSLTLLTPGPWFQVGFAVWMALVAAGLFWYLGRVGPRGASLAFAAYMVLGAWGTGVSRFDLVPAAFTLFCLVAAVRGRFVRAYVLLAIAVMLKLYPLPLLLPLFLAEQRARSEPLWRWKRLVGVGVFAATCAGVFAASLLVSVQGALGPLNYFTYRPIQIESAPASMLWVASLLGHPICSAFQYGSLNVYERALGSCATYSGPPAGPLTSLLSPLFLGLLVVGVVWAAWMQWRGKLSLKQAFVAILLVIILTGKVFSPQYFIWLAPLVAYTIGLEDLFWFAGWCLVSLLTTIIYPYLYGVRPLIMEAPSVPAFYPAIAYRNLLLGVVVIAYLFDLFHLRSRSAEKIEARQEVKAPHSEAALNEATTAVGL